MRKLFNILNTLSFFFCILATVLLVVSIHYERGGLYETSLLTWEKHGSTHAGDIALMYPATLRIEDHHHPTPNFDLMRQQNWLQWGLGLSIYTADPIDQNHNPLPGTFTSYLGIEIPLRHAVFIFAILPTIVITRNFIHLYRRKPVEPRCPTCGYDLRATPNRCPECGTPIPPPLNPKASTPPSLNIEC